MEFNRIKKRNKTVTVTDHLSDVNPSRKYAGGNTFLHIAAQKGNLEGIKKLFQTLPTSKLNEIIEVKNQYGSTPLHFATWAGRLKIVQYLVNYGANLKTKDTYGQTLLHAAAWNGHLGLVKFFFEQGLTALEAKDEHGNTPLLSAAKNNHLETVKWLVSMGADIKAKNNDGDTVLFLAAESANLDIIDYLVRNKQVNLLVVKESDFSKYNTLLHLAILKNSGHEENPDIRAFVEGLLQYPGVNIDAQDSNGNTSLHIAAEYANLILVEHLVELGADIGVKNNDKKTPLDFANAELESGVHSPEIIQKYTAVAEYLKNKKAEKVNNPRLLGSHQTNLEELGGNEVFVRDEDLFSPANLIGTIPELKSRKVQQRLKKTRYDSSPLEPQAQAIASSPSTFDMVGFNESLPSLGNTSGFFAHNYSSGAEASPFNLSSIPERGLTEPERGLTDNLETNSSNVSEVFLLASTLFNKPRKKHSTTSVGNDERLDQQTKIIDAIETFDPNVTATKPFN